MPRFDLTTLGEACIRFATRVGESLAEAVSLDVQVAGSEGNVAGALAHLGWRTAWVSRLPAGTLTQRIVTTYQRAGVDLSGLEVVAGGRVGTLYLERHQPPRATRVTFDRRDSAFTTLEPGAVPWELLLDTRVLHLTGITSPLSPGVARTVAEAVDRAHARSVPVSYDVNYRSHLWSAEDCARVTLKLARRAAVLFCSHRDARLLFGAPDAVEGALDRLQELTEVGVVVMSLGPEGVAARIDGATHRHAATAVPVIDRAGAGDALADG